MLQSNADEEGGVEDPVNKHLCLVIQIHLSKFQSMWLSEIPKSQPVTNQVIRCLDRNSRQDPSDPNFQILQTVADLETDQEGGWGP